MDGWVRERFETFASNFRDLRTIGLSFCSKVSARLEIPPHCEIMEQTLKNVQKNSKDCQYI